MVLTTCTESTLAQRTNTEYLEQHLGRESIRNKVQDVFIRQ